MKYRNFRDLVKSFDNFASNNATNIRPFIKTKHLTYSQLQLQIYKTANYLLAKGLQKGDRVMIVAPNSPQWLELFLASQIIGVILVPVDARNNLDTAKSFAKQTNPKLIFKSKNLLPKLGNRKQTVIVEYLDELIKDMPIKQPNVRLTGEETALIVFTSGTTAEPKGVVLTQKNILSNVVGVNKAIQINPKWRILSVLPLSHMYELTGTCCMLSAGVGIYYLPRIVPLAIAKALNDYKITTILAVPQLLILFRQRILQTAEAEGQLKTLEGALKIAKLLPFKLRRLLFKRVHKKLGGHLEIVITGGAPIPFEVADFWEKMGVKAIQGYGLTETAPILTVNRLDKRRSDSQGIKLHNVQIKIAKDGEILAKGDNIFKGYWQNPRKTKQVFTKDGWFKTGDVGRFDGEWLKIQGRAKFAIILPSGLNVYPEDIEAEAENHKTFKEICVVGVYKPEGEEVQAVVISDKNDKKVQQAIDDINTKLESYQYINNWMRWPDETFPRTLLLKIDRKNIQLWANNRLDNLNVKKPVASTADPLTNIIRLVLSKEDLAVNDNDKMAELGLDSLRRLAVVSLIEEQLGVTLNETLITPSTTVKDLRKFIKKGGHVSHQVSHASWQYNKIVRFAGNATRETLARLIIRIWIKIKVEGLNNLNNLNKPAIFIFNHVDYFDAGVVYGALPKEIRNNMAVATAADMLEKHKMLTILARFCYAGFNLDRSGAVLPSLEYATYLIDRGWNVAIAPEGQITRSGKLQDFKSGIGLLAVETGAPIVIVKTEGLYGTFPLGAKKPAKRSKVTVKISRPMLFDNKTHYEIATRKLHKAMKKL